MADVDVDVRARGAKQAAADIDRAERATRGLGRSARRLGLPLLGAGLLTGFLGGSLVSLAASSGVGAAAVVRLQAGLDQLFDSLLQPLETPLYAVLDFLERNPWAQQVLAGVGALLALRASAGLASRLVRTLIADIGALKTAMTALAVRVRAAAAAIRAMVAATVAATLAAWRSAAAALSAAILTLSVRARAAAVSLGLVGAAARISAVLTGAATAARALGYVMTFLAGRALAAAGAMLVAWAAAAAPLVLPIIAATAAVAGLALGAWLLWRNWDTVTKAFRESDNPIVSWFRVGAREAIRAANSIIDTINRIVRALYSRRFIPVWEVSTRDVLGIPIPEVSVRLRSLGGSPPQIPRIPTPSYLQPLGYGANPSEREYRGGTVSITIQALDTEDVQRAMTRAAADPQFRRTLFGFDL